MVATRSFFITALLLAGGLLTAQKPVTRDLGTFSSVGASGNVRVELYKSDTTGIVIEATGTDPGNVITENNGKKLSIRLKNGTPKEAEIRVLVYFTRLESLTVGTQALITSADVLKGDNMEFKAGTGGKMELELDLASLDADVRQGALLVFRGTVEKQTVSVNTGGTYSGYELEARDTYVKAVAGGKAKVTASRTIDANANAKGFIGYTGDPANRNIQTSLGGEIDSSPDPR